MRTRRLGLLALIAAGAIALSGCSSLVEYVTDYINEGNATRDDETGEVVEAGQGDVFELSVGDCFVEDGSTTAEAVTEIPLVACDELHDWEVYADLTLADGEWPGEDEVFAAADEACLASYEPFVGLPYEESVLIVSYFVPTEGSWSEGDRLVSCFMGDPDGQVTGTLEGALR